MERRYKLFLTVVLIFLVAGAWMSPRLEWYLIKQGLADTQLQSTQSTRSEIENQLLWFAYQHDQLVLCSNPVVPWEALEVHYLNLEGEDHLLQQQTLDGTMSGTFLAVAEAVELDLNQDGTAETVLMTAKTDANETQGYADYSRVFGGSYPIELIMDGKEGLLVYVDGQPYHGAITIYSKAGVQEVPSYQGESIPMDVRDLRDGLVVQATNADGAVLLGSYCCQEHTVFTPEHGRVMVNFLLLMLLVGAGVMVICFCRRQFQTR